MTALPGILLDDAQRLAWLRLWRSENVGPVLFYRLLNRFGGAAAALDALPHLARRGGRARPVRVCAEEEAAREMERLHALGAHLLARGEAGYPRLLALEEAPPPLLALRGRLELSAEPCVAIVGARNASAAGRGLARRMAAELAALGHPVVSGLARGIDTAAHEGALEQGTIAVLAGGLDVPYPRENMRLMQAIGERGLLVAEMPPGTAPRADLFPRRNRLVAGMSLGVVVVEAARRSGSLITARLAAEMGREVMAVPGSPLDGRAAGPNHLLREGATLVRHARDVAEALAPMITRLDAGLAPPATPPRSDAGGWRAPEDMAEDITPEEPPRELGQRLLALLTTQPVDMDVLTRESGAPAALVAAALMELELAGYVCTTNDGKIRKK